MGAELRTQALMLVWEAPNPLSCLSSIPMLVSIVFLDSVLSLEISFVRISVVVW